MTSVLTVDTEAETYDLTVLKTVKRELGITDKTTDDTLQRYISGASAFLAKQCNRVFASESVTEVFRAERCAFGKMLPLARYPVSAITSVTEDDDTALATSDYELSANAGLLYRLCDDSRTRWRAVSKITVVYTAGYVLLTGLPREIEEACISLVKNRWFASSRDPMLKAEETTGIDRREYWVGSTGSSVPPDVQDVIDLYRSPTF